jgi:hypothetical protein
MSPESPERRPICETPIAVTDAVVWVRGRDEITHFWCEVA